MLKSVEIRNWERIVVARMLGDGCETYAKPRFCLLLGPLTQPIPKLPNLTAWVQATCKNPTLQMCGHPTRKNVAPLEFSRRTYLTVFRQAALYQPSLLPRMCHGCFVLLEQSISRSCNSEIGTYVLARPSV